MAIKNTINYLLTPIANVYWANLENAMSEIGLHSGQIYVLISLWEKDKQSQIELARNLNLAAPTINKMVKNLSESGFVTLQKSEEDGRLVLVLLTDKGRNIRESVEKQWIQLEDKTLKGFTETEKLILFQLFEKLLNNLS